MTSSPNTPFPLPNYYVWKSRLGRYEIVSEVGRGGMGIVYRGIDTVLNRTVAIKTISLADQGTREEAQQLRARLIREAQAAATLSHPNIVTVHDVGQQGDSAFVVMEFVHGGTLDGALSQPNAPRTPEAVLKVLEDVACALDYAHAHGIVHRDVKPANIFINENGGVKLGDFGVAKVAWTETMTATGTVAGSPHYMAPEQLKGERVTGRTDQFAMAAVAYRRLTGHKPFDGDTFASLASKILFEVAPSLEVFGVRLGSEAEKVLQKALAKNPTDRYPNCTEFVDALKDAIRSSVAAPQPLPLQPPKPVQRNARQWGLLPGVAGLVVILAVVLFLWVRQQRAEKAESAAWETARNSKDAVILETYLKQYPRGRFAADAQHQLETLRKAVSTILEPKIPVPPTEPPKPKPVVSGTEPKMPDLKKTQTAGGLLRALGQRLSPKDGLVYVRVPAGTFQMGCVPGGEVQKCDEEELPAHSVTLTKDFWIGETEVTVEAYQHFAEATGAEVPPPPGTSSYWREPKQPMLNVTWEEAGTYCRWAGGRLPTEAEWEYAARAGTKGPMYGKPEEIAWYSGDRGSGNSDYKPHPVGQKTPNALGLYDMLGNAQEWVREAPEEYGAGPDTDPAGPVAGSDHVLRGGGFQSSLRSLRADSRYKGSSRSGDYGFRCGLPAQ